ncbi:MAG TPA: EAL domain-containing protein, partial [Rhodospirillaceae bacterium]|nr:EAL domain-containing protein [Rhodospirillaceae bacterium]
TNRDHAKLFINIDNRTLAPGVDLHAETRAVIDAYGLSPSSIVFEISERHPLGQPDLAVAMLKVFRENSYRLAIDDFGSGFSGLQMLYFAEPEFLKIDRFFVSDIANNSKKKLFLTQIVNIAHLLGVVVLAEGVETEREYLVCKEIGCDLLQGYLVQKPTTDLTQLRSHYDAIASLSKRERRTVNADQKLIGDQIDPVRPIRLNASLEEVFERFREEKARTFFPVVDLHDEPLGIIREQELKSYAFSRYGQALMANPTLGRKLKDFLVRCPVADINSKAEQILQGYSVVDASEGIIITDGMRYKGFLSTHSLLKVINEKDLAAAREQNPLSKLPGNNAIHGYISEALEDSQKDWIFVYFDFDNFKPFNDQYGFRLGDRAILLFSELMAKVLSREKLFTGHVGGDDFFAGYQDVTLEAALSEIATLLQRFRDDVESFYDDKTRQLGWSEGHNRNGKPCRVPLLGVSAAVLHLPAGRPIQGVDEISRIIAILKKQAKDSASHIATQVI